MPQNIHFLSGLPRSGSTLLSALLNQHPSISCAGHSTPVCSMMTKVLSVMNEGEYQTEFTPEQTDNTLRSLLTSYHASTAPTLIDNNRAWCTKLQVINFLYPNAKIICCVRDPVWIINSFERVIGGNPTLSSRLIPIEHRATIQQRVDHLVSPTGAFGFAYRALQEAFYGQFASKLILIRYEKLVSHPIATLRELETILDLPPASYTPNAITYTEPKAYDDALGTPGLHTVAPKVEPQNHPLILPPDIVNRLANGQFWTSGQPNPHSVTIL